MPALSQKQCWSKYGVRTKELDGIDYVANKMIWTNVVRDDWCCEVEEILLMELDINK